MKQGGLIATSDKSCTSRTLKQILTTKDNRGHYKTPTYFKTETVVIISSLLSLSGFRFTE
jgi:hypothetical protein